MEKIDYNNFTCPYKNKSSGKKSFDNFSDATNFFETIKTGLVQ